MIQHEREECTGPVELRVGSDGESGGEFCISCRAMTFIPFLAHQIIAHQFLAEQTAAGTIVALPAPWGHDGPFFVAGLVNGSDARVLVLLGRGIPDLHSYETLGAASAVYLTRPGVGRRDIVIVPGRGEEALRRDWPEALAAAGHPSR